LDLSTGSHPLDTLPQVRRIALRVDAAFLFIAGLFGLVSDLQSYASASGPFGPTFYQNPSVIGVVEAHSLAVLTAGTLWFLSTQSHGTFWALGCGGRPCRDGREQHRLVRGVHAGAGGDSRDRSHGGAFCLRRRPCILHRQHGPHQRRLRREPTGFGWCWACSSSSGSFMCRRRSLEVIAGRAGFSSARWLLPQQ